MVEGIVGRAVSPTPPPARPPPRHHSPDLLDAITRVRLHGRRAGQGRMGWGGNVVGVVVVELWMAAVEPACWGAGTAAVRRTTERQPRAAERQLRGADDAFSHAVADHHRELARFAFRLCGDRVLAEDIVAEAYARVWPHWRQGRVDGLLPYLMRAVANEAFTRHRRRRLERTKEPPPAPLVADPFEGQVDDHDELWSALGQLSPQHRVVLVLRIVEDLSEEQTAAMLGIRPGTVKSRLSRALTALRTIVEASHG